MIIAQPTKQDATVATNNIRGKSGWAKHTPLAKGTPFILQLFPVKSVGQNGAVPESYQKLPWVYLGILQQPISSVCLRVTLVCVLHNPRSVSHIAKVIGVIIYNN